MTREEAIEQLKLTRAANKCNYADKYILDAFDMAIRSLEAWEKVKEEIKESSYERYFEFGEYIGEDTQKIRIIGFDTAMDIIGKHLKEVENADSN